MEMFAILPAAAFARYFFLRYVPFSVNRVRKLDHVNP
jgi:hypothetical protein